MDFVSPVLPGINLEEHGLRELRGGEGQPQYRVLPCIRFNDPEGTLLCRMKLNWRERLRVLFTGNVWLYQLTFGRGITPVNADFEQPQLTRAHESELEAAA
jgi:hypothetical protein